jgi:hypothetical protein
MLFGLTNAPMTFQAYINKALNGLVNSICIMYLDDILIYSDSKENHKYHIHKVFTRLWHFGLYTNIKKREFFVSEVDFLGFIISKDSICIDFTRVESITN